MALSEHVTHYGLQSGFRINLTTPIERTPLSATYGDTEQLCGFEPWKPSPIPSYNLKDRLYNGQIKKVKMTVINITLHRK